MPAYRFEALDAAGKSHLGPARGRQRQGRARAAARPGAGAAGRGRRSPTPAAATTAAAARFSRRHLFTEHRADGLDTPAGRAGRLRTAARARPHRTGRRGRGSTRQRELVAHLRSEVNAGSAVRPRAGRHATREFDEVYRARGRRRRGRAARSARCSKSLADDLEERQDRSSRQADRRDALPGDRLADRGGDRGLPRHLRGAAGRQRCSRVQQACALPMPSPWRLLAISGFAAAAGAGCSCSVIAMAAVAFG